MLPHTPCFKDGPTSSSKLPSRLPIEPQTSLHRPVGINEELSGFPRKLRRAFNLLDGDRLFLTGVALSQGLPHGLDGASLASRLVERS